MRNTACVFVAQEFFDVTTSVETTPERVLLAAILWRAYWDLQPGAEYSDKISAIRWFENSPYVTYPFPYDVVIDILELSAKYQELIRNAVFAAKYRNDKGSKAETGTRKHRCMIKRTRHRVCA